ncbi:MAG: RNA polymerase sigma factor [Coprobacillaceae bacterium]
MKKKRLDVRHIKKLKQGDSKAFNLLFDFYKDQLFLFAMTLVKNPVDAEEVVQETFVIVSSQIGTLKDEKRFHSWIFKICYNQSMLIHRKNKRSAVLTEEFDLEVEIEDKETPRETYRKKEIIEFIQKEIENLPKTLSWTAQLYYLDSMSVKEIAEILDIPESTVKNRIMRSKKLIKQKLEKYGYTPKKVFSLSLGALIGQAFEGMIIQQNSTFELTDSVLKEIINGHKVGAISVSGMGLKIAIAITLGGSGYLVGTKVLNAESELEIASIQYIEQITPMDIDVIVSLNQDIVDQEIHIENVSQNVKYTTDGNSISFCATKNGTYTIQVNEIYKEIHINNIDKEYPILNDVVYIDNTLLSLEIIENGSGLNYKKSYLEYQGEKLSIPKTHEIAGEFIGEVIIVLYDHANNQTIDTIEIQEVVHGIGETNEEG